MRQVMLEDIEVKVWRSHVKIPMILLVPILCVASLYVMLYFGANSKLFSDALQGQLGELFGADLRASELVLEPDLGSVHLYGASLREAGEERPVVAVDEVHATLSRAGLLTRHIHVTSGRVVHPRVRLRIDKEGELDLLRALGLYDWPEEDPNEPPGKLPVSLTFEQVDLEGGEFFMTIDGIFEILIPQVEMREAKMRITNDTLLIDVPKALAPHADLRFYNELFGFPQEAGDWTFAIDEFEIDTWRWSNSGYTVEQFTGLVEGYTVEAGGHMSFPVEGDDGMVWGGHGHLTAPFWSSLIHYFVGETIHYAIPSFEVEGEGTLNWVESRGTLRADRIDAAGIQLTDLQSEVALHDQLVEIIGATFSLYGGRGEVDRAYFDMFELVYSGDLALEGVNLAPLTEDFFGLDAEYLSGSTSGSVLFSGTFPEEVEYKPEKFTLYEHTTDRWVDLEFTSPMIVERTSREIIPAERVVIEEGATMWVDQDRVVVPNARLQFDDQDVFDVEELVVNYDQLIFEPYRSVWGGRIEGTIANTSRYLDFFDIEGVRAGRARADLRLRGELMSPDVLGALSLESIKVGDDFDASSLEASFEVDGGDVRLDSLKVAVPGGLAEISGDVELLRRTAEPDPELEFILYESNPRGAIDLAATTRNFDLAALSVWLPSGIDPKGKADVRADIKGRLDALLVCADVETGELRALGEPFEEVRFVGSYRDPGVRGQCDGASALSSSSAIIDAWSGGRSSYLIMDELAVVHRDVGSLSMSGGYALDGKLDLALSTSELQLGGVAALDAFDVIGTLQAVLDVEGSLDAPQLSGSVRGRGLGASTLRLGDLAMTMDTLTREVEAIDESTPSEIDRVVYLAGGILPWFKVAAEVPLDVELDMDLRAPIYARFDVRDFDLVDFVHSTGILDIVASTSEDAATWRGQLEELEQARASGQIEVFAPPSFDRVNVLVALDDLDVGPSALSVTNREPVILSYRWEEGGEQSLVIDSLSLGYKEKFLHVAGYVSPEDEFVDLNIDGELDLGIIMTLREIFPDMLPEDLMSVRGAIEIAASFRGQLADLLAEGLISWRPTTIELRSFSEPIAIREGEITFTSDGISIAESAPIEGNILGGVYSLFGEMKLDGFMPESFLFSLWTHNITYAVPEVANVTLDTDLELRGEDIENFSTWKVSGDVEILDGLFYQNISVLERELTGRVLGAFNRKTDVYEASIFDEIPELAQLELDLSLRARDGFKLKNQIDRFGLDLEFRIDLKLANTIEALNVTGDVEVIEGNVLFQGETFVVRTGTVRFQGETSNPFIDVVAVADIRNACRGNSLQNDFVGALALNGAVTTTNEIQDETYQISLNVRGDSDNLNILYDSVPFADQRDIISLILTGCTVDLLTASSASQPTLETILGPLIGRLEREIQEVARVEEFNITPGVNRTQVLISDELTRRLSWRFRLDKSFNEANSTGQSGQLEYQLTDRWAASLEESSYSDINTSNRFQIDLKLNYRVPLD